MARHYGVPRGVLVGSTVIHTRHCNRLSAEDSGFGRAQCATSLRYCRRNENAEQVVASDVGVKAKGEVNISDLVDLGLD